MKKLWMMSIMLLFMLQPFVSASIISLWKGENTLTDSVGTNHGTAVNGVTYTTGIVGNAISLNGTNYIKVGPSASLKPTNFTIVAWVNPASLSANTWNTVFACGAYGTDPILGASWDTYYLGFYDGRPRLHTCHSFGDYNITGSTTTVSLNTWHMLAATFDGASTRLYFDGALVATGTPNAPLYYDPTAIPTIIGEDWNSNAPAGIKFNGKLDEMALYNNALATVEIQYMYNIVVSDAPEPQTFILLLLDRKSVV